MTDRPPDRLRNLEFRLDFLSHAEGSCLVSLGGTRVICAATVQESVPRFLEGKGTGWVTAEYDMLPRSTHTRRERERGRGRPDSRSLEISRLVGRAMRAVVDCGALGERTVVLDCDVIDADGGTRCASVCGASAALHDALRRMVASGALPTHPMRSLAAAVSVGIVDGVPRLDLCYELDRRADVDMNVVMSEDGRLIEIQGTAEHAPFERRELDLLLDLAAGGIREIIAQQRKALGLD